LSELSYAAHVWKLSFRISETGKGELCIVDLTAFIESRDWKALPGDAPLVASLLSILLSLLAMRHSVKEGVDYLEQEVLAATLTQIEKIQVRIRW